MQLSFKGTIIRLFIVGGGGEKYSIRAFLNRRSFSMFEEHRI
jgi:hypothetical protein